MTREPALVLDPALSREAARRRLASAFAAGGIASADLDARVLLCAALGIDHAALLRDPGAALGAAAAGLANLAARRLRREPVSRIIGYRDFWGARLALDPATLDPRPDSETLVEAVLAYAVQDRARPWRLLDLGVGSGALLAALLQSLPNAFGLGIDVSPAACAAARTNLAANGLAGRSAIACANWADPVAGRFDAIVANPPYIRSGDIAGLVPEVALCDPPLALDGGPDGLAAYRAIIPAAAGLLAPSGILALEVGAGQDADVAALVRGALPGEPWFQLDLGGFRRIVCSKR